MLIKDYTGKVTFHTYMFDPGQSMTTDMHFLDYTNSLELYKKDISGRVNHQWYC